MGKIGKISLFLSIGFILSGIYLLYLEIKTGTFIAHRSMAIAFIFLGIGMFFHFRICQLETKQLKNPTSEEHK